MYDGLAPSSEKGHPMGNPRVALNPNPLRVTLNPIAVFILDLRWGRIILTRCLFLCRASDVMGTFISSYMLEAKVLEE